MRTNTLYRSEIRPNLPDWLVWKDWRSLRLRRTLSWGKTILDAVLGGIGDALLEKLLFHAFLSKHHTKP